MRQKLTDEQISQAMRDISSSPYPATSKQEGEYLYVGWSVGEMPVINGQTRQVLVVFKRHVRKEDLGDRELCLLSELNRGAGAQIVQNAQLFEHAPRLPISDAEHGQYFEMAVGAYDKPN